MALALLKVPTGALTAFLGLLMISAASVPGLTALDSSARRILSWAVLFGYSQELVPDPVSSTSRGVGAGRRQYRPQTPGGPGEGNRPARRGARRAGRTMTTVGRTTPPRTEEHLHLAARFVAPNYDPLPVVVAEAEGAWVTDVDGRRYLDCLAGTPRSTSATGTRRCSRPRRDQLDRVTLTSRAFHHDQLGPFCRDLAELTGKDRVLPMNTGAEAVETAIKIARKWGYDVKGVPTGQADDRGGGRQLPRPHDHHRQLLRPTRGPAQGFGPFTPGFRIVGYGDLDELRAPSTTTRSRCCSSRCRARPGVIVPPAGYLAGVRELCTAADVLFVADEIQSGLGRTGTTFACDLEGVVPDVYVLGKALGGGIVPVSAVVADRGGARRAGPGQPRVHVRRQPAGGGRGACGGAAAPDRRAPAAGARARPPASMRGCARWSAGARGGAHPGLWAGVDVEPGLMDGRELCERMLARGVLVKETHGASIRLAPPLVVDGETSAGRWRSWRRRWPTRGDAAGMLRLRERRGQEVLDELPHPVPVGVDVVAGGVRGQLARLGVGRSAASRDA